MTIWMMLSAILALAPSEGATGADAVQLNGTWVSECLPIGQGGRHGYITTIRFDGPRIDATAQVFARNTCDLPTLTVEYRGRLDRLENVGNRTDLQHRAVSLTLTPQDRSVVELYNRDGGGCGLQDWRLGIAKSVAGRRCGPFSFPNEQSLLFDSVWTAADGQIGFAAFPLSWIDDPRAVPRQPLQHRFRREAP